MNVAKKCIPRTDEIFDQEVLSFDGLVVVNFWAEWSGSCHIMTPIFDQLADDYKDKLKMCNFNFEKYKNIAQQHGVNNVPTILFFKKGELIDCVNGIISSKGLTEKLNFLLR